MERLFVGVEIEINRISTTTNKKSEKANHEFLHFLLFSLTLQSYTIKTAFPPFYCIILLHPSLLVINHTVETSRADIERIEGIGTIGTVFEKVFFGFRLFSPKKVQMKRSVTGDDTDGCCPQRKSPCPTLVGRKTKALYEKAD